MRKLCCAILIAAHGLVPHYVMAQTPQVETPPASVENHAQDVAQIVERLETASQNSFQSTNALASSNMRVGFVNFRRIMSSIPQLASLRDNLQREFRTQQQALEVLQAELSDLEQKINNSIEATSEVDLLTQQLISKRREFARQQAAFQDDYNVRRNEELAKLQNIVLEEIVALAKAQNFDVILNDNGVIYVSQNADLTQLVIERLLKQNHQNTAN